MNGDVNCLADRTVDDDLVAIGSAQRGDQRDVVQSKIIARTACAHLNVILIRFVRPRRERRLRDQESFANRLAVLILRREQQTQSTAIQSRQDRDFVWALEAEVINHGGEKVLPRLEDGDLTTEDLEPNPEVGIQTDGQISVDREDTCWIVDELVQVDSAIVDRGNGVALTRVVIDVESRTVVWVVIKVEHDSRLDVAFDPRFHKPTNTDAGTGEDLGAECCFGQVAGGSFDAVIRQIETFREDERDLAFLVATFLELVEAPRAQAEGNIGGHSDFTAKLGVEARKNWEALFVQELQVERRQVVLEQHHVLAGQQAEDTRRVLQQRESPGTGFGAEFADDTLG